MSRDKLVHAATIARLQGLFEARFPGMISHWSDAAYLESYETVGFPNDASWSFEISVDYRNADIDNAWAVNIECDGLPVLLAWISVDIPEYNDGCEELMEELDREIERHANLLALMNIKPGFKA
jgi:hypothetical protein